MLLRAGYAYVPYSILESVIEKTKEQYDLALRQMQGTIRGKKPDWRPWVGYFLKALQRQKQRLETKIKRERGLRACGSVGLLPNVAEGAPP